jgi:hypothetical protein
MGISTTTTFTIQVVAKIPGDHKDDDLDWWVDRFRNSIYGDDVKFTGNITNIATEKTKAKVDEKQRMMNLHKKIIDDAIGIEGFKYKSSKIHEMIDVRYDSDYIIAFDIEDGSYRFGTFGDKTTINLCNPDAQKSIRAAVKSGVKKQLDHYMQQKKAIKSDNPELNSIVEKWSKLLDNFKEIDE